MTKPFKHIFSMYFILLSALIIFSCSQPVGVENPEMEPAIGETSLVDAMDDDAVDLTDFSNIEISEETNPAIDDEAVEAPIATPTIYLTPTPDLRLLPAQWQQWPVIPEISHNAIEIYWRGIAAGNDPQRFSKIGDCQSIKEVLLGIYDLPNRYRLREGDDGLQDIIDQFAGSFNRDGMAVKGGFNAATVLSPIWADPELCKAGETPIECEFRVHNPSIVIISLEVWWEGRSPERYEQYMRKIIETAISQGIVPILSTKADNVEGNHNINFTTAKLAYEYDIPLWNFWLAAQSLPHQGIDPDRDGFHITVAAWNERSYTALKSLEAVWQATHSRPLDVLPGEDEEGVVVIEPVLFPSTILADYGITGKLFIETTITRNGIQHLNGVYVFDFDKGLFESVLDPGYQILNYHPAYGLLVANATELGIYKAGTYLPFSSVTGLVDDQAKLQIISENSFVQVKPTASSIGISLYEYNRMGNVSLVLEKSFDIAMATIEDVNLNTILVKPAECNEQDCELVLIDQYLSDQPILTRVDFGITTNHQLNEESTRLAYWKNVEGSESLFLGQIEPTVKQTYFGLFGNVFLDQEWSREGTNLAAIKMRRSDYYGKATELLHFIVDAQSMVAKTLPDMEGLNPQIVWSHDDLTIATSATQLESDGSASLVIRLYDIATGKVQFVQEAYTLQSDVFIAITNMMWLP
jgi:hypothetical protein